MNGDAWISLATYLLLLLGIAWPLGLYMARVADTGNADASAEPLGRWGTGLERALARIAGVEPGREMGWRDYAVAMLVFNLCGVLAVYLFQRTQGWLPLNPAGLGAVAPDSAFNTAVSFVTNTNWQGYAGETTMSHFTQMSALAVQNFLSAATGIAVVFALMRGFARRESAHVGNFWLDVLRACLYLLLPGSLLLAVAFAAEGVIQDFAAHVHASTVADLATTQAIAMGPVASQEAIKMLGTNGGGFFNANSAHPFENPSVLTNLLQVLAILSIPAGLCFTFGRMVGDMRQGWALIAAMTVLFVAFVVLATSADLQAHPGYEWLGVDAAAGNMEGKETRFGVIASNLFATITTAASCGAVNAMHDSLMPMAGFATLLLMQLGEVVFGGVGAGLYGMLLFALLAVFVASLMIGRAPEYLGKKVEAYEMKLVAIAILAGPMLVLLGTAIVVSLPAGTASLSNPGAHGFAQALYAFSSAANNNGSAFAGLSANTPLYNALLAIAMWIGRFGVIVPVLAIAGSLASKKRGEAGAGTLPTHGPLFVALLVGVVLLVGALTYLPALALGPVAEHLQVFARPEGTQ